MRKGELKRSQILETAEKLFFEKGYEQTSIQDILDALSLSKGGFYHHFASKEAIMSEICEKRVENRFARLNLELCGTKISPIDKLNLLLRMANLFEQDEPKFVAMMLKICYLDEDIRLREHMRSLVIQRLKPLMNDVIEEGIEKGVFFTRNRAHIGAIALHLVSECNDDAYRLLAQTPDIPETILEIADLLNACRDCVEMLFGAPFASVELFDPARLVADYRAAAMELSRMEMK